MKHLITIAILFFALNIGAQATDAKIYVKGNYFFIEKDDRIYEGLSKEVLVKKLTPTSTEFFFSNVNNWLGQGIELVNILDESGTAYTTASWEAFYTENTGSFSNGGGSGVGLNWESTGVYAVNDIVNYAGVFYKNLTGVNTSTSPDADATNWEEVESGSRSSISDADGDTKIQVEETPDDDTIRFDTSGNQRAVILPNGNVGIGTTNPTDLLHLYGNRSNITIESTNNGAGDNIASFNINSTYRRESGFRLTNRSNTDEQWLIGRKYANGLENKDLQFLYTINNGGVNGNGYSNFMTIKSSGNVGIGETLPTEKLHVEGNARITGEFHDSNDDAGAAGQVLSSTVTGTDWVDAEEAIVTQISETEYNAIADSNAIAGSTDATLAGVTSGAYTGDFGTLNTAATHQVKNTQSVFAIKFRHINSNTATRFVAALTDTSTGIVEYVSVPLLYTSSSGTLPYNYMKLTGFKNTTGVAKSLSLYNITAGMATTTNSSTNYGIGTGEIGDDLNAFTFSEVPYQFVTNYVPYEKIVIWAEESAGLGSNQLEWSFGDGASGNIGIPLPEDWEAYAVSFNADNNGAADTIEMAIINSNTNTNLFTFTASGNPNNMVYTEILATPVAIPAGTSIGFRTVTEIGNVTNARVAVFLRRTP